MVGSKTDNRCGSALPSQGTNKWRLSARDQMGIQQFRVRSPGIDRREGFGNVLRRLPAKTDFRAARDENDRCLRQEQEYGGPSRLRPHAKREEACKVTDQSSTSGTQGDGGIYSNVQDLARWDRALTNHSLLGRAKWHPPGRQRKKRTGRPYIGRKL